MFRTAGSLSRHIQRQLGQHAALKRCFSTQKQQVSDAKAVVGGVLLFCAADRITAHTLQTAGLSCPPAVANVLLLGACAFHPGCGRVLERVVGPGAAWLRAGLPIFLVPVIVGPVATDLPDVDVLQKMMLLTGTSLLFTMAVAGHTCNAFMPPAAGAAAAPSSGAGVGGATPLPSVQRAAALAGKFVSSPRAGALLAVCGVAGTAAISLGADVESGVRIEAAPLYAAATAASYFAAPALTPARLALYFPPTLFAGATMLGLTAMVGAANCSTTTTAAAAAAASPSDPPQSAPPPSPLPLPPPPPPHASFSASWKREGQAYLAGPAKVYTDALGPAIATLGMLTHTHRAVLVSHWRALVAGCMVAAPVGLLFTGMVGGKVLHLSSREVASLLPATTTTGLAVTMAPALPMAFSEWIPIGTVCCGLSGMAFWPVLLRITRLNKSSALARGFAVGAVSHVSGVAGLAGAGQAAAADAAALGLFMLGVVRCLLLQIPGASTVLLGDDEPDERLNDD